jgi:hypothetical protein
MEKNTLKDRYEQCIKEASLSALNSLVGAMKRRIHQEGKKTDGSQIGDYSQTFRINGQRYVDYRAQRGRQTNYIDLHLEGDLENSFQVGQDGSRFFAGFDSKDEFDLAQKHTTHYGQIWKPSDEEIDYTREAFSKIYQQCLNKLFKK